MAGVVGDFGEHVAGLGEGGVAGFEEGAKRLCVGGALGEGDVVKGLCGTANGIDAWISVVDAIST